MKEVSYEYLAELVLIIAWFSDRSQETPPLPSWQQWCVSGYLDRYQARLRKMICVVCCRNSLRARGLLSLKHPMWRILRTLLMLIETLKKTARANAGRVRNYCPLLLSPFVAWIRTTWKSTRRGASSDTRNYIPLRGSRACRPQSHIGPKQVSLCSSLSLKNGYRCSVMIQVLIRWIDDCEGCVPSGNRMASERLCPRSGLSLLGAIPGCARWRGDCEGCMRWGGHSLERWPNMKLCFIARHCKFNSYKAHTGDVNFSTGQGRSSREINGGGWEERGGEGCFSKESE